MVDRLTNMTWEGEQTEMTGAAGLGDSDALTRNRNGFRRHGECGLGPWLYKPMCRLTD